jgi:type IV pilus assembly protein PilB
MSAVQTVNTLLQEALRQRASDIHLEPTGHALRVRLRVDGLLSDHSNIPQDLAVQVVARIKVVAGLDVAEKRMPQDGKFSLTRSEGILDLRVATFPSVHGEKVVIRLLPRSFCYKGVEELGCSVALRDALGSIMQKTNGLFLVTGPTGSGKTTTLYALLTALASVEKNIVTLEDPIEYTIAGVTQGQVQPDIGFTFARGIRALLRQDPDVIMIGEIRDKETAEVAIQAALTGHLVLSTAHTTDAVGAVLRLLDMGIPAFLINATLTGVLAQRLVRVLCPLCKVEGELSAPEQRLATVLKLPVTCTYRSVGCTACEKRGYRGRTGIFELLLFSEPLRELISQHICYDRLYRQALAEGMISLHGDASHKVATGVTTLAEVARALL